MSRRRLICGSECLEETLPVGTFPPGFPGNGSELDDGYFEVVEGVAVRVLQNLGFGDRYYARLLSPFTFVRAHSCRPCLCHKGIYVKASIKEGTFRVIVGRDDVNEFWLELEPFDSFSTSTHGVARLVHKLNGVETILDESASTRLCKTLQTNGERRLEVEVWLTYTEGELVYQINAELGAVSWHKVAIDSNLAGCAFGFGSGPGNTDTRIEDIKFGLNTYEVDGPADPLNPPCLDLDPTRWLESLDSELPPSPGLPVAPEFESWGLRPNWWALQFFAVNQMGFANAGGRTGGLWIGPPDPIDADDGGAAASFRLQAGEVSENAAQAACRLVFNAIDQNSYIALEARTRFDTPYIWVDTRLIRRSGGSEFVAAELTSHAITDLLTAETGGSLSASWSNNVVSVTIGGFETGGFGFSANVNVATIAGGNRAGVYFETGNGGGLPSSTSGNFGLAYSLEV